ncbi:MAG TPA: caspase family protein [Rubricoccaceae bacterium]|nr:caspase family protein [Rubricoccaceae bacterium]
MYRSAAFALVLLAAAPAAGQGHYEGALEEGDAALASGEFIDTYAVALQRGTWVEVVMRSDVIDPFVILRPPGCTEGLTAPCEGQFLNDDFFPLPHGGSFIWVPVEDEGMWEVMATSFAPREVGPYTLDVIVHPDGSGPQTEGVTLDALRTTPGTLAEGNETLNSGEYVHRFRFAGREGDRIMVDLRSSDFDPYVILQMPNGQQLDNDDWEGDPGRARIEYVLPVAGVYHVLVTTAAVGETGDYTLTLEPRSATLDAMRTERGTLAEGDGTLTSGEFVDRFTFEARAGDRVVVDLLSSDFDPYVILQMPDGRQLDNDDWEGARDRARIEHVLPADGLYSALVTSYAVGETGDYTLTIEPRGREEIAEVPNRSDVIGGPDAGGDQPLRTGRDRALLFATDTYADPEIRDLVNPVADAEAIAAELEERYGFEVEVVRNPTRADVYAALSRYAEGTAGEDDQLLVFFAGHGTFVGEDKAGRGFLIPSDGRSGDRASWISYSDLADELDLLPAHRVLLVLDVCFGGSFVEQYRDAGDPYQTATPADIVGRYGRYRARLALTSGAREYVSDGRPGQHSPFAFHFLRALRSSGGYNADGLLLFDEVVMFAREVDGPTPLSGGFGGNEPGSTFFFGARDLH